MASTSTQPIATADKSILTPVMTLEGHKLWNISSSDDKQHELKYISYISYFPDGKQMISGSGDKTIRRWDLRKGKEIEKDRDVYENVRAVLGVSRDGRWVVIAGVEAIKVSEVETGTLLAGGSSDGVRIWNLDTGKLVAGPFDIGGYVPEAVRFSEDSRKLAVSSYAKECQLQVWDVQIQKLEVQKSAHSIGSNLPIFWTTKDKSIVAAFNSPDDKTMMIYEFDASTLKSVGAPFKHTYPIYSLALSSECVLLASACNRTIKLWAFESRQLLASFDIKSIVTLVLSPDSRQLAYTTLTQAKIYICDIPANILAIIESTNKSKHPNLFSSNATRRTVRRKPVIIPVTSTIPRPLRPLPTTDSHTFLHSLRKLFPFSRTDVAHTDDPFNPLDFPATSPLPRSRIVSGTDIPYN
ncbi:prolyl oligopeptidase [Suillus brevipes Sb2]|nr:prolyl oligopeptidase [Suillus brevipes Sb2]